MARDEGRGKSRSARSPLGADNPDWMHVDQAPMQSLNELVRVRKSGSNLAVLTHESSAKEFKESFTWGSIGEYARTMAAFANARGGYLIFGVSDNPRFALGLSHKAVAALDNLDRARLTQELNELFSPELEWEVGFVQVAKSVKLGVLYTHESTNKPVIARKAYSGNNARILEGDILYRYNSRTERIKYPELIAILDDAKLREQRAMMTHIEGLVRAGARNAAVLDFSDSSLHGPSGRTVVLDESLIDQIKFIKEGEFDEVHGAPTLKVVGTLEPATTIAVGPERIIKAALSSDDVLGDFLAQTTVTDPKQYVRQTATGVTSFLPVHYYRRAAGMSKSDLIEFVKSVVTRSPARKKLLDRLESDSDMMVPAPSNSAQYQSTVARREFYDQLIAGDIDSSVTADEARAKNFVEAIRSLSDDELRPIANELLPILKSIFDQYYDGRSGLADPLRRAACRIDAALHGSQG